MESPPEAGLSVSVVMPVLNEARDIERLLLEVLGQVPPPGGFEVLVADGGSTDGTREIVARLAALFPNLRLLDNSKRLSSAGRNVGARAARGRYVMFLDGHCHVPRQDYLVRLVEIFQETGAHCLCRPQPLLPMAEGPWARAIAAARHSWLGHNAGSDIFGAKAGFTDPRSAGAAYLRSVIDDLGGYDERFDACEDVEFNRRVSKAGYAAYTHPDLSVPYRPRSSLRGLWCQMVRYGRGRARLMRRYPRGELSLPLLAPVLFVAVGVAAALWNPLVSGILVLATLVVWALAAVVEGLRLRSEAGEPLRIALALVTVHAGLLSGFYAELASIRTAAGRDVETCEGGRRTPMSHRTQQQPVRGTRSPARAPYEDRYR